MQETVKIPLRDKIISLKINSFDTDVDVDDILKIDYANIMGEVLTFPVLMNRIGLLKAEQEEIVSYAKLDLEIYQAQLSEEKRKSLTQPELDSKGNQKMSKPTVAEVDNAVLLDKKFRVKKEAFFRKQRDMAYIESLYWAAKSKDDKLNKLSNQLIPSEHEGDILEGTINGILIKMGEKLIR